MRLLRLVRLLGPKRASRSMTNYFISKSREALGKHRTSPILFKIETIDTLITSLSSPQFQSLASAAPVDCRCSLKDTAMAFLCPPPLPLSCFLVSPPKRGPPVEIMCDSSSHASSLSSARRNLFACHSFFRLLTRSMSAPLFVPSDFPIQEYHYPFFAC